MIAKSDLTPAIVTLDDLGTGIPALLPAQRWNGWECPYFRPDDLRAVRPNLFALYDGADAESVRFSWNEEADLPSIVSLYDDDEEVEEVSTLEIDDETFVTIGWGGYCWYEVEQDPGDQQTVLGTVLGLVVDPGDECATLSAVPVGAPGGVSAALGGGLVQALEIDGGSVIWIDESGKANGLATNLLATKIAHRLNAGLYPDDTIHGRALVLGESAGPDGELMSVDLTSATITALRAAGVELSA